MKILFNLISIKKGGGQQVASNFILHLMHKNDIIPFFLVTENTYIHKKLNELGAENIFIVRNSVIGRVYFQLVILKKLMVQYKIAIIYTIFGPGLQCGGAKSITGCAYSNLFFPEIDFWQDQSLINRVKLKLIDRYRLASTLKSDAIIFENEAMMNRAHTLFNFSKDKMKLILPSISEYPPTKIEDGFQRRLSEINKSDFNVLMLTGWHKNKNIELVPFILKELRNKEVIDIKFIISVSAHDSNSIKLKSQAKGLGVEQNIIFIDSIQPHEVPQLFEMIDAVTLLSLLESFSNNIIEAWHFNKPLFISNEEWATAICKEAAIYVKRNDAKDIAEKLIDYRNNSTLQDKIKMNVANILPNYPNAREKVVEQIEFLKKMYYA